MNLLRRLETSHNTNALLRDPAASIRQRFFYCFVALLSLLPYLQVPGHLWDLTHFLFSMATEGEEMGSKKTLDILGIALLVTFNVRASTNK